MDASLTSGNPGDPGTTDGGGGAAADGTSTAPGADGRDGAPPGPVGGVGDGSDPESIGPWIFGVRQVAPALVEKLNSGEDTAIVPLELGGQAVAKKLKGVLDGALRDNKSRALVIVDEAEMQVSVPASIFRGYMLGPGEDLALIVASDGASSNGTNVTWITAWLMLVRLPVGSELDVVGLPPPEPVSFSMPPRFRFREGGVCEYFEEGPKYWSRQDVWVGKDTEEAGLCWCETTHFTLFRAILIGVLDAVLCAQFSLFNIEALRQIGIGDWFTNSSTLVFWVSLIGLLTAVVATTFLDQRRKPRLWSMEELFMIPVGAPPPRDSDGGASEDSQPRTPVHWGFIFTTCSCCSRFLVYIAHCVKDTALGDALNEVVSTYFEHFELVRSVIEDLCADDYCVLPTFARIYHFSRRAMTSMVMRAAQKSAAAHMNLSLDSISFVLFDKHLADLLAERHRHLRMMRKSLRAEQVPWWRCQSTQEAWAKLHTDVSDRIQQHLHDKAFHPCHIWMTFKLYSPIGQMCASDIFANRKMRALFHMMELGGTLMVVSLFFIASGQLKSKKRATSGAIASAAASSGSSTVTCGDQALQSDLGYLLGRDIAVSIFSVILAGFPVTFVQSLHTRKLKTFEHPLHPEWKHQLRIWQVQDRLVWCCGTFYLAFCIFFMVLFLANLSDEDQAEWTTTAFMSLLADEILLPLAMALFMPILADILVCFNAKVSGSTRVQMTREAQRELLAHTNVMLPLVAI